MDFGAFLQELRRRRVDRVAGGYLVAGFVVLQVGDVVIEPLGLPPWVMTLLVVLVALGLPVALAMAWAFQVGPDGVQRHEPAEDAVLSGSFPWGRKTVAALLVLALGAVAWLVWPRSEGDGPVDADLVAALPFRVSGADPSLGWLEEGLMDLLAARFGVDDALRIAPPREVVRALESSGIQGVPGVDEAASVARSVGAGSALLGDVTGTPDQLTIHTTVVGANGEERLQAGVSGSADSVQALVDRLAARLLAAEAGTPSRRLAEITTHSLPALRAYLEGKRAFRAGQPAEATRAFDRAVDHDSTFALAAFGLSRAQRWAPYVSPGNGDRAERLAWRYRDRLNPRDRLYLEVTLGENHPDPTPTRVRLDRALEATTRLPDYPDLWYRIGDIYLHYGRVLGVEEPLERAEQHFQHALALDSTYMEPLTHLLDLAARRRDTAAARRYGQRIIALSPPSEFAAEARFMLDRMGAADVQPPALDTITPRFLADLGLMAALTGLAVHELGDALMARWDQGTRNVLLSAAFRLATSRGRVQDILRLLEEGPPDPHWGLLSRMTVEMFVIQDSARTAATVNRWETLVPDPDADPASLVAGEGVVAHWRLMNHDTTGVRAIIEEHEAAADTVRGPFGSTARFVALTLTAIRDHVVDSPRAEQSIQAVERVLDTGTPVNPAYLEVAALTLGRMLEERGELERALAITRRTRIVPYGAAGPLRHQEARLADRLGRNDLAIEIYTDHLYWYRDAQPPVADRLPGIRARLAELTSEDR